MDKKHTETSPNLIMKTDFDIDIDFADRDKVLNLLKHDYVKASIDSNRVHNSGVYFVDIPSFNGTNISTLNYKEAEERGYLKMDFLNVHVYNMIRDEKHLTKLLSTEPDWNLLKDEDYSRQLIHVGNYSRLLKEMMPDSIPRMAMFLAIIRPGKKHLQHLSWKEIAKTVWNTELDGYTFKKSHAVSYAHLVVVHMNLLCQGNYILK